MEEKEEKEEESSDVDHTLLESLFYNEMMLMEESPSLLLSVLSADGKPAVDANTMAETALLGEFGVAGREPKTTTSTSEITRLTTTSSVATATATAATATTTSTQTWQGIPPVPPSSSTAVAAAAAVAAARAVQSNPASVTTAHTATPSLPTTGGVAVPPLPVPTRTAATTTPMVSTVPSIPPTAAVAASHRPPLATHASAPIQPSPTTTTASTPRLPPPTADHTAAVSTPSDPEKRKKLESQFATLASRLGINLPPELTQSTAASAAAAAASTSQHSMMTSATTATVGVAATQQQQQQPALSSSVVQELQHTAEAAIAAVTRNKRSASADTTSSASGTTPTTTTATTTTTTTSSHNKRRKKPRLVDCERKLAALKAENALLKRHLSNISNQSHKLQQEQRAAELQIRKLWTSQAPQEELDAAIEDFSELYSDYGKRRQAELQFHLKQLQTLANPTEVTKMGLWTLGQQSTLPTNRIAGLLQKELGITPQQGKKILEQREKIRTVMSNLKESLQLLGKLNALCEQKTRKFHDRMSKCREILTPRQVVKLILWIDDHSEILDQVCPGWGSEHIPSAPTEGGGGV